MDNSTRAFLNQIGLFVPRSEAIMCQEIENKTNWTSETCLQIVLFGYLEALMKLIKLGFDVNADICNDNEDASFGRSLFGKKNVITPMFCGRMLCCLIAFFFLFKILTTLQLS